MLQIVNQNKLEHILTVNGFMLCKFKSNDFSFAVGVEDIQYKDPTK